MESVFRVEYFKLFVIVNGEKIEENFNHEDWKLFSF